MHWGGGAETLLVQYAYRGACVIVRGPGDLPQLESFCAPPIMFYRSLVH